MLRALAAILFFTTVAAAGVNGLCNTGQTSRNPSGCTGVLIAPNPPGGGPNRDGNWGVAYPYPSSLDPTLSPCALTSFTKAWVDTPYSVPPAWLPNSISSASEWITPYDGEGNLAEGWFVYITPVHVPSVLPGGILPTSLTISGRFASDNDLFLYILVRKRVRHILSEPDGSSRRILR
jgi:hypothetical protein